MEESAGGRDPNQCSGDNPGTFFNLPVLLTLLTTLFLTGHPEEDL